MPNITIELEALKRMTVGDFQDKYLEVFGEPSRARHKTFLWKRIAWRLQALEEGGPITEGLVREIHKRLVEGVRGGAAAPGDYRKIQNYVVNSATGETVYAPPPAHDVPIMMAELLDWLNQEKDVHPVLASGVSQFQFVHIHPFLDGNGRTSRLLSTLYLYQAGYDF
jgi:Fic family protein